MWEAQHVKHGVNVENPKGMTVDDLRWFLEQCRMAEIPAEAVPIVRITLGGKIKRVEVQRW